MVESKLRVEVTLFDNANTHYYGNVIEKKVVEDVRLCEFDKRNKTCIAPCGINATIAIDKSYKDSIERKKYYYINKSNVSRTIFTIYGEFIAFFDVFDVEDKVYELYVMFNNDKTIKDLWLSEWLEIGYFQDGDDADNIYKMNEFTSYETFEQ